MSTWESLADLSLEIDRYELRRLDAVLGDDGLRSTTVVYLHGDNDVGLGEDVTYAVEDHDALHAAETDLPVAGTWTLASFSRQLAGLDLFPSPPQMDEYRNYRRWAFESAALDLALRQAGTSLHSALRRDPAPVRFVSSVRLPDPPSLEPIGLRLRQHPDLQFKLDPTPAWDEPLIAGLAALGVVAICDLKGLYVGTTVDNPPDPALYRRVVDGFPTAWIEDPAITPQTEPLLALHHARITWDVPIHSVDDIRTLEPAMLNIKPSRIGSIGELLNIYDYCAENGIGNYGGGQTELGVGRGQIEYLASLFHHDAPNDVAPAVYNLVPLPDGLPGSPLTPAPSEIGFRWAR